MGAGAGMPLALAVAHTLISTGEPAAEWRNARRKMEDELIEVNGSSSAGGAMLDIM